MLFNPLKYIPIVAVLLVAGFALVATPATALVVPVLSVPDELTDDTTAPIDQNTIGIQVYGVRAEPVPFELTITFQTHPEPSVKTRVTGFDVEDILLFAADSNDDVIPDGAVASRFRSTERGSVYTATITARGNISKVFIQVPDQAARTIPTISDGVLTRVENTGVSDTESITVGEGENRAEQLIVNIVRSAAPPLTLTSDKLVRGDTSFTVTLTSTKAITLKSSDLKVTNGYVDSLTPDTARRVWTLTIIPLPGRAEITVEAASDGAYIFTKGTFTVDTTGPVAKIGGAPGLTGGPFPITIAFNEPLQAGTTLLASEINVTGGTITPPTPIPGSDVYSAILTPNPGATTVTVQVNTGAVADAGGVQNAATPSTPHPFTVAATAPPPGTTPPTTTPTGRGNVTISEIMFATDGGASDIQWIELFNSSKTETAALDTGSGWKLIIENYTDRRSNEDPLSGTINFKEHGDVKRIAPRQTVLIVSANGRNSGTTHAKGRLFVSTRVFEVHSELARAFGMRTARDPFLHPTKGFHIELADGRGNLVDEVGNLDGRTRTADEPAWKLPNGWTEDRDRTSIIRRYDRGRASDGTQRDAWILAAKTSFLDLSQQRIETWYGLRTDHGSPGIRAGGALPVQLSQFRPNLTETGAVVINWTTESEVDNAGFNILRGQTRTGEFTRINTQLIPGAGTTAERHTYVWTDTTAKPNVVYYYQIEDVSFDGERQTLATVRLRGFISAKDKLTTQWGELKRSRD